MHLCQICEQVRPLLYPKKDQKSIPWDYYNRHHERYLDLKHASDGKCFVCTNLWSIVSWTVDPTTLRTARPATFCLAFSSVDKDDGSSTEPPSLVFYRKEQSKSGFDMVFIQAFDCIPCLSCT
jgi:hypothetical protein